MPHFNNMMNSDAMKSVGNSFNAYTDSVGKFVNSFSDKTPGSTWNSFKNMHTGAGAPFAYGVHGGTALAMANAFGGSNNGNGGGGGLTSTLNTAISIIPGMMPYILGYKLYNNWVPKIKNFINTWGPKVKAGARVAVDASDIINYKLGRAPGITGMLNAAGNVSDIRNDPAKTKRILDFTKDVGKTTGNWDFYRESRKRFGGTADEWAANTGTGELVGAVLSRGDFSGLGAKFWRGWQNALLPELSLTPDVYVTPSTAVGHVPTPPPPSLGTTAQKAKDIGMNQADVDRLTASLRTGRINGSLPVFDIKVNAPQNVDTFAQQRNMVQQLRRSGALNQQAYIARMQDIAKRQRAYNDSVKAHQAAVAEAGSRTHDDFYNEALNSTGDRNWASEYARSWSDRLQAPRAPSAVNIAKNKPAVWNAPNEHEFKDGKIQIAGTDQLAKFHGSR